MARVPDPKGFSFSIATRIRVVVAGLAVMVLVLVVASVLAHRDLQRVMMGVAGNQIPAIEPMRRIHESGQALLRLGAELRATGTEAIAAGDGAEIDRHAAEIADAIARLVPHDPEPMALADLDNAVASFARAGHELIDLADRSRGQQARIADRLASFEAAHLRLINGVDALMDGPVVNLMGAVDQTLDREGDRAAAEIALRDMLWQGIGNIRRMGEAKAEANLVYATAIRVLERPARNRIGEAEARFDVHARRLQRALEVRDNSGLAGLPALGDALVAFGQGDTSLFALGRGAVALEAEAVQARSGLASAAEPLRAGLAALYERTSRSMAAADDRAVEALLRDQMLLGIAIAVVLAMAIAFGWIYVSRSVAAPLRRLGPAAAAVEAGHFDAPLPRRSPGEVGQLTRAIAALRDRSRELVRLRRRMIRGDDDSSVQDRLRVQLLTSLVEDVRVPVERMNRSVHLLRSMNIAPEGGAARDCLEQLDAAAADVLHRLEEGIGLAGFWNGEAELAPDRADLVDLVEDAVASLDLTAAERARRLSVRVDATLPLVQVDADRVRHMLVQMVAGGIAAGGAVELDLGPTAEGGVAITASDRGAPLAVREVERRLLSLDRFGVSAGADDRRARLRAVAAGTASVERSMAFGRGLGLLLCEAVADAHGGRLSIDSAAGRGTRLSVVLPPACVLAGRRSRAESLDQIAGARQA